MKTLTTYESPDLDELEREEPTPEEQAWHADRDAKLATYPRPRTVTLPGREPLDLEAISDLWLD
ncbi:MAG TPA: hypothetical protein VFN97_17765 [Actinospica sp.]|nr:hypothetical protein [Actinospica sp.]